MNLRLQPALGRTLAVFSGGIGDTLLAGPAFAELHARGPLDLAGNPERLALIQAAGACDSVFDLDRIEFHTVFDEPSPSLREFLSDYSRIIVWMRDDGAILDSFTGCGFDNVQAFPGVPPYDWTQHGSDYYLSCAGDAARPAPRPPVRLMREGEAPAEPAYDVLIHPGSGSPKKNWPISNFASVADALERVERQVAWLRGPAEELVEYPRGARIVESGNLMDLARRLAGTKLYIGNDSGITHVAAAAGCRTVAIFGPTDADVWAPRGECVEVVSGHPWPTLEAVLEARHVNPR